MVPADVVEARSGRNSVYLDPNSKITAEYSITTNSSGDDDREYLLCMESVNGAYTVFYGIKF